jgi:putative endonuclease
VCTIRDIPLTRKARYTERMDNRRDSKPVDNRRAIGMRAETIAADRLRQAGLTVIERNVRLPEGEIDLVCRERDWWVFVEVKCRRPEWGDAPAAAVSWHKQRRIIRLAQHYMKWRGLRDARCRFDVVSVTLAGDGTAKVRHIPSAFDATGF